jgi:membrane protein
MPPSVESAMSAQSVGDRTVFAPKQFSYLVRNTLQDWNEDKVPRLGAALAFYTAISIAPLVVLSLRVASIFFDDKAATGQLRGQMQGLVGEAGAAAIEQMIAGGKHEAESVWVTILGVATLLFGASGVFGQLQDSLNTIWEVQPKAGRGLMGMIRDRFLSFSMVLGVAFLLVVSLLVSTVLSALGATLDVLPDSLHFISHIVDGVISIAVFTGLFGLMFKVLPDVKISWRDVWVGAALTAVLFFVGKLAIGLYLGHSAMASSYGAAGSFVVLLVWVYYAAQVFFLGAEFTQVYANEYGSRIVPAENAEPVTEEKRAQEGERPSRRNEARLATQTKRVAGKGSSTTRASGRRAR